MQQKTYNSDAIIGRKYERGLLPYGGAVSGSGIITYAMSEKDFNREMEKLRTLE